MKKKLIFGLAMIGASAAVLGGCGGGSNSSNANETTTNAATVEVTQEVTSESRNVGFENNILTLDDIQIKITDYEILAAGTENNQFNNGSPIIVFHYDTTNFTDKEINAMTAWLAGFRAYQDNDPNVLNELDIAVYSDSSSGLDTIKKDGTVSSSYAYVLDDLETPVTLKAHKGYDGTDLGEQVFELAAPSETTTQEIATDTITQTTTIQQESNADNNTNVAVELDENKRATFSEYAPRYEIEAHGGKIVCELLKEWSIDDSSAKKSNIASWVSADLSDDAVIMVQYNYERLGDGTIEAYIEEFKSLSSENGYENGRYAETTVDGLKALYTEGKTTNRTNGDFTYDVPLKDGTLYVSLYCMYDDKDKYIEYLDMVASGIVIPSEMKPN